MSVANIGPLKVNNGMGDAGGQRAADLYLPGVAAAVRPDRLRYRIPGAGPGGGGGAYAVLLTVAGGCHSGLVAAPSGTSAKTSNRQAASYRARSGNSPGIQRGASAAGKARRNGARGPSEVSTP